MQANPAGGAAACMIVANPAAGSVSESLVEQIAGRCARYVSSVSTYWTAQRGDASSQVREFAVSHAGQTGLFVVVAVGGDGTVLEVVRGLAGDGAESAWASGHGAESAWASGHGAELAWASGHGAESCGNHALFVVPAGTGNSNYRALWGELPWPEALDRALSTLPGSIARVDLAHSPELGDLIVLGAGAGLSAEVLMSASEIRLTGRARLAGGLQNAAAGFTPYEGRVTVDGAVLYQGPTVLANVGGSPYRAWQYLVLPHSLLDDGLLDVCVVSGEVRPADVPGLLLTGAHVRTPGVFYGRGERVVIERLDGAPLCFEHDGELIAGISPRFTVQVLPGALAALCGPASATAVRGPVSATAVRGPVSATTRG
jgi:diacylglycerol kinase (ATP)